MQLIQDHANIALIAGLIVCAFAGIIWAAVALGKKSPKVKPEDSIKTVAETAVQHIFDDEFREELRNRGRLHFEKVISENAMFLQQDLRLTTSEVNQYIKQQTTQTLKEAFKKYEQSIQDAKEAALESMSKTQASVEEQRQAMLKQLTDAFASEKEHLIKRFEENMSEIVNHYVIDAIGNQISLEDQLEYILSELERNKQAIIEDIKSGT